MRVGLQEQKKLRKRLRKEKLQDKRDRIRMGLAPPDPPKGNLCPRSLPLSNSLTLAPLSLNTVRLANLMKVLTSDAIQDPTRVEARVRREVAMRKHTHEKMNAERKLTDDQRREKVETKKMEEEKKGIIGAVFKSVYPFLPSFFHSFIPNLLPFTHEKNPTESKSSQIQHTNSKSAETPNSSI